MKTYVYKPENGKFRNAENLFNEISKYEMIEYVKSDGSKLHSTTPPKAWKTLGVYNGYANKMLRDGCTWSDASKMKLSKTDTRRYGNGKYNLKIDADELVLTMVENENDEIRISKTGVFGKWELQNDVTVLIKRASDIAKTIKTKNQSEFQNLVLYYVKSDAVAILENYRVTIKSTDSIDDARAAMVLEMGKQNDHDYTKLVDVKIDHVGLEDFIAWFTKNA